MDDPVVRIAGGAVRGHFDDRTDGRVAVFRGIPFAQPPVGGLRFAAPQPVPAWDGVREAKEFGPPPPQSRIVPMALPRLAPGADPSDWLTVNVWSPSLGPDAALPVMVWIYGGAYRAGASAQASYDGIRLAERGVVVVTFNHRVGVEGFAQLPGMPPNRSLLDDVAALHWVRENIAAFGGDPDNVTVFGESAGAGAVGCLLVMPLAIGLFRRAIAQSFPGTFFSPALAADITGAIAVEAGIPATAEAFAATNPEILAAASDAVVTGDHPRWAQAALSTVPFSPVVDGEVLPSTPWQAIASGAAWDVDLLTGHNRDEYRLFLAFAGLRGKITQEMADELIDSFVSTGSLTDGRKAYRTAYAGADAETLYELVFSDWLFRMPTLHLAQAHAAGGGKTFLYELVFEAGPMGACHALDVPLVFGVAGELGEFLLGPDPSAAAVELGDLMRSEWVAFAATGDPGWTPYSPGRRMTRIYGTEPDVIPYPETASMHIWDQHRLGRIDLR
ncbi:MAG TPA: carboxylesterase family protein [Streptosporangiaceae bacterium]